MHNLNLNHLFKSHISRTYLAQNIEVLCLIFAFISGLLGTAFSVLIRIELSVHGVQYIADNQLYNAVITAHAILMIFFMVMPALIGGFGNKILLPLLIILCFCFFILSISFLVPEYFAGDNVNLSSSNLPPLRSLGLLSERHPSKSLSDWIIEESSRILAERGKGVDPSVLQSQTYYKSVTLGDLNLKYDSVDGDIIKRVTEEYLSSKNWTLDNKIPLDRLCSSLSKVRGSNWQTNVVYSDSLGSSSIKHSFVELLRSHNN